MAQASSRSREWTQTGGAFAKVDTDRGISNPFLITIATNVVFTGMTPIGMWAADYVGRRPLMLWGGAGMAVSQLIVAIVGTATPSSDSTAQKVLVAFVCLYIATFAISWATLAWVMTAEINPYELRAKGMTMSTASNWLWNWAIGFSTPFLVDEGPGNAGLGAKVFFIWGGCCVAAVVWAYFVSHRKYEWWADSSSSRS